MDAINPFTVQDKETIRESIRLLDSMIDYINKMKSCGVECSEMARQVDNNRKRLNQFLVTFWPNEVF